jgi:putative methanogenesis marker protein 2
MDLKEIVSEIRNYPGVTRKRRISEVVKYFEGLVTDDVVASFGEDAAVIDRGEHVLLLATDGIMEDLMQKNAIWAGYCSVLVNVNDIAAMGGKTLGLVNVISVKNEEILNEVLNGIREGLKKFGVPMIGGHVHPDSKYNAVDVAILGMANKDSLIFSSTANEGDDVIFAMDIDGSFTPGIPYSWDTTSSKDPEFVQKQIAIMEKIGKNKLVSSGKDISNPGSLGTLGMLLESSKKGAEVDLSKIPTPDGISFLQWLKAYQGFGFVVTCNQDDSPDVIERFNEVGAKATVAGKITSERTLTINYNEQKEILFNFEKDIITGL